MRILSLFSGCGGLDLGMEGGFSCLQKSINKNIHPDWIEHEEKEFVKLSKTNFKNVFACDIKPSAKATWCNFMGGEDCNSYKLESVVELVKRAKNGDFVFPKNIDIITGGFPCQDFSLSGKRMGFDSNKNHLNQTVVSINPNDSRGKLYTWMKEIIAIVKPKMFIAENVKGLAIWDEVREQIIRDFASEDYLVVPFKILNAENYGVPQSRSRIFFIGFQKQSLREKAIEELSKAEINDEYDPYPKETHSKNHENTMLMPLVTCRDAFVNLEEPDSSCDVEQQAYSKAKFNGEGQGNKEINLDSVSMTIRSEHHGNIEFRRLSKEHNGKYLDELNEGKNERRLTIRECARLQTFPDDYKFLIPASNGNVRVSASEAYRLIGNAVPCLLGYNIAKNLEKKWSLYFKDDKKH